MDPHGKAPIQVEEERTGFQKERMLVAASRRTRSQEGKAGEASHTKGPRRHLVIRGLLST